MIIFPKTIIPKDLIYQKMELSIIVKNKLIT